MLDPRIDPDSEAVGEEEESLRRRHLPLHGKGLQKILGNVIDTRFGRYESVA